ncbi:MAG: FAD-binding protein [Microthrixaceae bacterium]
MSHVVEKLRELLSAERVVVGEDVGEDYTHDECLTVAPRRPAAVVFPENTAEVADILRLADAERIPVTARGSGNGPVGIGDPRPVRDRRLLRAHEPGARGRHREPHGRRAAGRSPERTG